MTNYTADQFIEKFKEEDDKFSEVQSKFSKYGASDSEPTHRYKGILRRALCGQPFPERTDGDWWELYTFDMKCGTAARSLTAQAKKVYEFVSQKANPEAVRWLERYYDLD